MPFTNDVIHFPVDTGDHAYIEDRRSLLAQDVYGQIAVHLRKAMAKADRIWRGQMDAADAFDRFRSHEAILLNGGRGTGKSSVLVNLQRYVASDRALDDALLILKPVDPTLLENGDDLFLNVIVAALMRERTVKTALARNADGSGAFYDELQNLGSALEGIQKIGSEYGLDKLQAFVENQELAEHVHKLFHSALRLTGKKLIVLPIDDVDTSLELAFENVEVVRKYLTSPLVVPLITGDLDLYDDVIYRQFAQRLTGIGRWDREAALQRARHLAEEYERKVLPLPRRIRLPTLRSYLDNRNIHLVENGELLIALPLFRAWLGAVINDRVNGEEHTERDVPLETVREFAQFVQATGHLLPRLRDFLALANISGDSSELDIDVKRRLFMSSEVAAAVELFALEFEDAFAIRRDQSRTQRTARERAYRALRDNVSRTDMVLSAEASELRAVWNRELAQYALHQRNWGSTYLVADANAYLLGAQDKVLDHDLFRPQRHAAKHYAHFDERNPFAAHWQAQLLKKAPEQWLSRLPETTLLSYPGPETGRHVAPRRTGADFGLGLARKLLVHWSYYSPTERGDLLLCGRIFELLVASLTCDLNRADLTRILHQPPFYSLAAFARTKTLDIGAETDDDDARPQPSARAPMATEEEAQFDNELTGLVEDINAWRATVRPVRPSAWLVFVVMNKFFSQAPYIARPTDEYTAAGEVYNLALQAFNLFWSAVGSFEKGAIFGLPQVVATVNMSNNSKNFEHHPLYVQNIAPFLQLRGDSGYYDFGTGSYTYALESHPLRRLWQSALVNGDHTASKVETLHYDDEIEEAVLAAEHSRRSERIYPVVFPIVAGAIDLTDKRIDRYVNEIRRELDMPLTTAAINAATIPQLRRLLTEVERRCAADPTTLKRFHELRDATGLPKNSGRRRLQRIMERLGD